MRLIDREHDLTRHVCANCGHVIEGPYAEVQRGGCRVFVCADGCEANLYMRRHTGESVPVEAAS